MSLVDTFLLESYRDPRDVWIAVRTDGAVGSGTSDDPFDGGTRAGPLLPATLTLDRKDVVFTTQDLHNYSNNQTIAIFGISGAGADLFNGNFSVTYLSPKSFKVTLASAPSSDPSAAPGLADNTRCSSLGSTASGTISHGTLAEFMEVTVGFAAAHGLANGDTVQISGATGGGAAWFNGTFAIYGTTTTQFTYRLIRINVPSSGADTQSVTSTKLTPVIGVLTWPAVKVTTGVNHDYLTDEIVKLSGAGSGVFNGEFLIHGPANGNTFYYRIASDPGSDASYSGLTCYRVVYRFDEVMRVAPKNSRVRLGPGVFETRGYHVLRDHYNPSAPARVINWLLRTGQKISGAGIGVTTVRLMYATAGTHETVAFGHHLSGPDLDSRSLLDFEVSDLTIDCNMRQQVAEPVAKGAIATGGSHHRLHRVRAIDYGTHVDSVECFVFGTANAHPTVPEPIDCRIEHCIAEQPSRNGTYTNSCMVLFSGEEAAGGVMGWHRAGAIRNNYINNEYSNDAVRIAGISVASVPDVGEVATITTAKPHNRVTNDWVVVSGAYVGGTLSNIINASYEITGIPSATTFTVLLSGTPTGVPTGEIWIERFSSHRVSVHSLERDDSPGSTKLTAVVTTHTPHNRKPGQWVTLNGTADPRPDGTAPYYGRFPIVAIDSTTVFSYRMNAVPRISLVDDNNTTSPPDGYASDGVFLGHGSIGFSSDGGSEAITECNRVFNTGAGGSYHDTWGTKDQTDRDNYYSDVISGPFGNMGDSSPLKQCTLNVIGNIATVTTVNPHGLVVGQAVRFGSSPIAESEAFYSIAAILGSNSFTVNTGGETPPGNYFGALWQVGLAIRERNVVDVGLGHHAVTTWGYSGGVRFYSRPHGSQYVYRQAITTQNIIDLVEQSQNDLARAIEIQNVENGIIANNLIALKFDFPIEESASNVIEYFGNQTPSGQLAKRRGGKADSELTEEVQDALLLSL